MKLAVFSTKQYDRQYLEKANADRHELHFFEDSINHETLKLAQDFPAICVFVNDQIDAELLEALAKGRVEIIALRSAGFNNVDITAADKLGIKIVRVPAYSPHAVAEHAVALILTLNRKTHKAYNRVREGNFSLERLIGFDMNGRTVGVVGTGQIGAIFAQIMQGFGCKVLAFDKYPREEVSEKGIVYTALDELLKKSDIVSLHTPLTPETHHMIDEQALDRMKNGTMLINTSRGGLVDTQAVIKALKSHKLGALGIDVYEQEDQLFFRDLSELVIQDDTILRLMTFPNVLVTAHQAFFTDTALTQIAKTTLDNLSAYEAGETLENAVTVDMVR